MKHYKTKVDLIYDVIIDGIASGKYAPEEHLVISQIAKQNGVSDIPVREAIRRLAVEGYVHVVANYGAVVTDFTLQHIEDILRMKAVLEGYATQLAVDYITAEGYVNLYELNGALRKAYEVGDGVECARLNLEFHMTMYQFLPYQELRNTITDLYKKYSIRRSVFCFVPDRADETYRIHEDLLRAMRAKDYDAVEKITREHKFESLDRLIKELQRDEKTQSN